MGFDRHRQPHEHVAHLGLAAWRKKHVDEGGKRIRSQQCVECMFICSTIYCVLAEGNCALEDYDQLPCASSSENDCLSKGCCFQNDKCFKSRANIPGRFTLMCVLYTCLDNKYRDIPI